MICHYVLIYKTLNLKEGVLPFTHDDRLHDTILGILIKLELYLFLVARSLCLL